MTILILIMGEVGEDSIILTILPRAHGVIRTPTKVLPHTKPVCHGHYVVSEHRQLYTCRRKTCLPREIGSIRTPTIVYLHAEKPVHLWYLVVAELQQRFTPQAVYLFATGLRLVLIIT